MVRKSLITTLFRGFFIQRWNDKIRPVILTEIDKNAHKMVIAYCLAKFEENRNKIDWQNIINGGLFEYLRRVTISDIKSPVYTKIRDQYPRQFKSLNKWVFKKLSHVIDETKLREALRKYLFEENGMDDLSRRILAAAHIYASYWEFKIIKQANPDGYQIQEIDKLILKNISDYLDLEGMQRILTRQNISDFIDLFGQLRFQVRWSQTPRIPETSVLGHSMLVAILAYLFSREIGACKERIRNNFFGGLFHDLPEALTRDIISPVKRATPGMPQVIKKIEMDLAKDELFGLIDPTWKTEMEYYIKDIEISKIIKNEKVKQVSSDKINQLYNSNKYSPIDGEIIKAADELAAFMEAYTAIETGVKTKDLEEGLQKMLENNRDKIVAGIDISAIYSDFS